MDPLSMAGVSQGLIGLATASMNKPDKPTMPSPIQPAQTPQPKKKPKNSFQDSFLTGVAGTGDAAIPRGRTLLGQ